MRRSKRIVHLSNNLPYILKTFKRKTLLSIVLLRINNEPSWFTVHHITKSQIIFPNISIEKGRVSAYLKTLTDSGYLEKDKKRTKEVFANSAYYLNSYKRTDKWDEIAEIIKKYFRDEL